jgi:ornithine carbamoyltransferase
MKDLLCLNDLTSEEVAGILSLAMRLKSENKMGIVHHHLKGKTLGMIFAKSSTRTRVSFEVGMLQLGGNPLFLSSSDIQLGRGESIYDTAKVLSRYLDGIMIRTFDHNDVAELAKFASIPIINGLTDMFHPCQALADLQTAIEFKGGLMGLKMAYVGDGNNVAHSLMLGCSKLGMNIAVSTPKGYECNGEVALMAKDNAREIGSDVIVTYDPKEAVADADVVYTDTWISMGMEDEKEERMKLFPPYQVNRELFAKAKKDAVFMHCLPAYRGYEVTGEVIDSDRSVIFDQAENRLHAQKAVMVTLMKGK